MFYFKKFKLTAFSLLELVAAMAIVAILMISSYPSYVRYVIRSKVSTAMPIMDSYRDKVISYYQTYGAFPTASQLGFTTTGNDYTIANPQQINKYTNLQIINTSCSNLRGEISFQFNASILGASSDFYLTMILRPTGGLITTTCGKNWDTGLSPIGSEDYLPQACQDVNTDTC